MKALLLAFLTVAALTLFGGVTGRFKNLSGVDSKGYARVVAISYAAPHARW